MAISGSSRCPTNSSTKSPLVADSFVNFAIVVASSWLVGNLPSVSVYIRSTSSCSVVAFSNAFCSGDPSHSPPPGPPPTTSVTFAWPHATAWTCLYAVTGQCSHGAALSSSHPPRLHQRPSPSMCSAVSLSELSAGMWHCG
eukprot:2137034-Rhodomonas_salina.3